MKFLAALASSLFVSVKNIVYLYDMCKTTSVTLSCYIAVTSLILITKSVDLIKKERII